MMYTDAMMPWLADALDTTAASTALRANIFDRDDTKWINVSNAKLIRHKHGRRALIEYTVEIERDGRRENIPIIGKIRAKGLDRKTVDVTSSLCRAGFDPNAEDGITVPEVIGVVEAWRMWLSPKAPGIPATSTLTGPRGKRIAEKIADAAIKLHRCNVPAPRQHGIPDELNILDAALHNAALSRPDLAERIDAIRRGCASLVAIAPKGSAGAVHRDFYADQVLVDGEKIVVLDLDLFAAGDLELDIGNFVAHVAEQSLRVFGDATLLDDVRNAVIDRACMHGASRELIGIYDLLSLARHIWISLRIPGRNNTTDWLVSECELRLESAPLECIR